jgi:selenoprotein W-related protein
LHQFEPEIEAIILIPSGGGRFEITVNGNLLYSKKKTGRHTEKGEAARLINEFLAGKK